MPKVTSLAALLADESEPNVRDYQNAAEYFILHPRSNDLLNQGHAKEPILLHISMRSNRLTHFFDHTLEVLRATTKPHSSSAIAASATQLLLEYLPSLFSLSEPATLIGMLLSVLELCFLSKSLPQGLQELSSVLIDSADLLKLLISSNDGSSIFKRWVSLSNATSWGAVTLQRMTSIIITMASTCVGDHDLSTEVWAWRNIQNVLAELTQMAEKVRTGPMPANSFPSLDPALKELLDEFGLSPPHSERLLSGTIERLQTEKTLEVLLAVTKTFPCQLCYNSIGISLCMSNVRPPKQASASEDTTIGETTISHLDLLGEFIGNWKILLSVSALKGIQRAVSDGTPNTIREKFIDLASGHWSYNLAPHSKQKHMKVNLAKTRCGRNMSILWQVDIDLVNGIRQQIVKVWEVGDHSQICTAVDRVATLQRCYLDQDIKDCRKKPIERAGAFYPILFDNRNDSQAPSSITPQSMDIRILDQETLEMANKFHALTEPLLRSVLNNDLVAELPLDLSDDEKTVINHFKTSSMILGRSGTGKTTCLIYKLVAQFLVAEKATGQRSKRQILITRSTFLADKIRTHTQRLISTLASSSLEIDPPIEDDEFDYPHPMVDESSSNTLLALRDSFFPFVCTFSQLLQLLENTVRVMDRQNFNEQSASAPWPILDYVVFELDYWPHFPPTLRKGLPTALVFSEIMGVIKGSHSSCENLTSLTRDEYVKRSARLAPTFASEAERNHLYDVFEAYEALKGSRDQEDEIDRVLKILQALRRNRAVREVLQDVFEEVYVDEVQDLRMLDIQLFLNLVKDIRGFHFAGDTAQAISQDSTFRFEDAKAVFYHHFSSVAASACQRDLSRPVMFSLGKNYRSHRGILSLASAVMGWLWKGFPETIDKLSPEVGRLAGPKPVLFLGCDASVLASHSVGTKKLAVDSGDFGAEQVILVQDEAAKRSLQAKIGNIALILTILQSKGMEFDDVILWDFFTGCPYPAGARALEALNADEGEFDGRKHLRMCSILKSLYVAVTRARVQLFLMESSDSEIRHVEKILHQNSQEPLVDISRPTDQDFAEKLETLRPGKTVDPYRWTLRGDQLIRQRSYEEALFCFEKAGNYHNATMARGMIEQESGRRCDAEGNTNGSTAHFNAALHHFREVNLHAEAAQLLIRLRRFPEAAKLYESIQDFCKAAPLYAEAGLTTEAVKCYQCGSQFQEAIMLMRKKGRFNELVSYLAANESQIGLDLVKTFSGLCKLLLKQGKVGSAYRKDAIHLLGSAEDQESFLVSYNIQEELIGFYHTHGRFDKLFEIYFRRGELEEAISLPFDEISAEKVPELKILTAIDFISASHYDQDSTHTVALRMSEFLKTEAVQRKIDEWEDATDTKTYKSNAGRQRQAHERSSMIKSFKILQSILNPKTTQDVSGFDDLPAHLFHEAAMIITDFAVFKDTESVRALMLLAGLWHNETGSKEVIALQWSPLRTFISDNLTKVDLLDAAKSWFRQNAASALVTFETKARELWRAKWPVRCVQFLARGFCRKLIRNESCNLSHTPISKADGLSAIEDSLRIATVICNLMSLYRQHVMPEGFQKPFLGVRRFWLETLLRGMTFISSLEQDATVIAKLSSRLFQDSSPVIASAIEDLLYYRLRHDSAERPSLSWLFEQLQLATAIGNHVSSRYVRIVYREVFQHAQGPFICRQLDLLSVLRRKPFLSLGGSIKFRDTLRTVMANLNELNVKEFAVFHAVIAVFESLTSRVLLSACPIACLLPRSWLYLNSPLILEYLPEVATLQLDERYFYAECLVTILNSFCNVLSRIESCGSFICLFGRSSLPPTLIQSRISELLATIGVNVEYFQSKPTGLREAFQALHKTLGYYFVNGKHLSSPMPETREKNFADSFKRYAGKNDLVLLVFKDMLPKMFSELRSHPCVMLKSVQSLQIKLPHRIAHPGAPVTSSTEADELKPTSDAQAYNDAIVFVQKRWQQRLIKMAKHREYIDSLEGTYFNLYWNFCARHNATIYTRGVFIWYGIPTRIKVDEAQSRVKRQSEQIWGLMDKLDPTESSFEPVDEILQRITQIEKTLKTLAEIMAEESLVEVIEADDREALKRVLDKARGEMAVLEGEIVAVEKAVEELR